MPTTNKFAFRIGSCGFALAVIFFGVVLRWGRTPQIEHWLTVFWPTAILLAPGPSQATQLSLGEFFKVAFSALMNGAAYFGVAWLVWWAAHFAGVMRTEPSPRDRFVSAFLAVGLGFTLLVTLAELAIKGASKFTAHGLSGLWLVSANLFALMVITCVMSGLSMWWLRNYFRRRQEARSAASPHVTRKS
jgi:hypothetical protein